jgi:hypothetical protein
VFGGFSLVVNKEKVRELLIQDFVRVSQSVPIVVETADEQVFDRLLHCKSISKSELDDFRAKYYFDYCGALLADAEKELAFIKSECGNIEEYAIKLNKFQRKLKDNSGICSDRDKFCETANLLFKEINEFYADITDSQTQIIRKGKFSFAQKFATVYGTLILIVLGTQWLANILTLNKENWMGFLIFLFFIGLIAFVISQRIIFGKAPEEEEE